VCTRYEEENRIIRETVEQQEVVIEKLIKAQELLMLQYKIMEIRLNKELLSIQKTQTNGDQRNIRRSCSSWR
jgi:hypothetical protein